jgi:CBS domain containing-hemolysin-like protein
MGWLLVAALALVLVAGWCASAEAALLRVSRAGAKELGRSPGAGPAPLQAVLAEVTRYVAVLVLARVAGEITATVLLTAVLVHWIASDWRAFLIAAAIMIVVSYAIAAVVPRSRGRQRTVRVATTAAGILRPLVRALGPFPRFLVATGTAFHPGSEGSDGPSGSEEELRGLVDLLEQRQIIQPDERAMIHSVFELGDTIVREVMVPRTDMVFVERDKNLRQALSLALRSGFSRIPVVGENLDDVVGIAYLKDIVTRSYEHREGESTETVDSVMRPATFVPESKPIDELLREMQARQTHVAIVIDEYGGTAGLATIEDILEEIVGEIADEYDREEPPVEWLSDGQARVTARLSVEELEELFDVSIEAEDVETVGGLLAQRLGRVPIPGATATVAGLRLTAESLAGRRNQIGSVRIARSSSAAEGSAGPPRGERAPAAGAGAPGSGPGAPPAASPGAGAGAGAGATGSGATAGRPATTGPGAGQPAAGRTAPAKARASRPGPGLGPTETGTGPGPGPGTGPGGTSGAAASDASETGDTPGPGGTDAAGGSGNGQVSAGRPRPH